MNIPGKSILHLALLTTLAGLPLEALQSQVTLAQSAPSSDPVAKDSTGPDGALIGVLLALVPLGGVAAWQMSRQRQGHRPDPNGGPSPSPVNRSSPAVATPEPPQAPNPRTVSSPESRPAATETPPQSVYRPALAPAASGIGRNFAMVVGINHYRNLTPLRYAKGDSEAIRDYLRQDLRCQELYHFSDDSPPIPQDYGPDIDSHPTFVTLRRFLRVRFEQPFLKPGDNLWFFFAGHGIRHEDRDYLMPIDADPGDVESTAIPLHYVTERLQRSGADNVILLLDACRSGVGRRGLGVGMEEQKGVITLFSCSPQESSYEIDELQQGAFTYSLLQALRLQGDANCATVERLYHYLRDALPQLNEQYRKPRQTPYGRVEPPTKNYLILLPHQATPSDVDTLKKEAMRAELRQQYPMAKQFWLRVLAVSPADLEAVEGIERLAR